MRTEQADFYGGRSPSSGSCGDYSELKALRATSRRQAIVIDTLRELISNVHRGAKALKAENAELRAAYDRLRVQQRADRRLSGGADLGEPLEVLLPADLCAPGAARSVVARRLGGAVASSVLDSAQLLVSELVTNSVRHGGLAAGEQLTVRVQRGHSACRLEVEDSGRDGIIAPRPMDRARGSGMGLNLVQMLSERWGLERVATGGTRIWAQLAYTTPDAPGPAEASGRGGRRSTCNGKPTIGRAALTRPRRPTEETP
jgi:anti-sigma regulatory factor (Ser/Thr protein kinase)